MGWKKRKPDYGTIKDDSAIINFVTQYSNTITKPFGAVVFQSSRLKNNADLEFYNLIDHKSRH